MFQPLERAETPSNYWSTFKSELNFDYYTHMIIYFVPFFMFYQIAPSLLPLYIARLKRLDAKKVNAFCTDVGSCIASLLASVLTFVSLTVYYPHGNLEGMQWCFRKVNTILCSYLLADTLFRCGNVPRNFWFMMLHHAVGLLIGQTSMYDRHWHIPKIVFCLMEVANPYINVRFMILALGYSKKTNIYKFVSTGMFFTFFISRIIPMPFMVYWQAELLSTDPKSQTLWHVTTTTLYVCISLMNMFWFYKMVVGMIAIIRNKDHDDL